MSGPLVSIVIPLYNYERYIHECLESALAQTHRNLDVVVVNDGSTDGGADLARRFGPPVRVLDQPNAGTVAAVNRGIGEARGEYVAWLSADDRFLPHKIERQLRVFSAEPALSCVYSNLRWHADVEAALGYCPLPREQAQASLRQIGFVEWDTAFTAAESNEVLGRLLDTTLLIYLGTSLIPRRVFDEIGLLDAQYRRSHDYEFAMRLAAAGHRFHMIEEPLSICRAHAGNTPFWKEIRDDENRVRRKYLAEFSLEKFYPRLTSATEGERDAQLAEHVRWLIHHGMLAEARAAYQQHVHGRPPAAYSLELGKAWMGARQADYAQTEFEKALQYDPTCMMAHYLRGDACRAQGMVGTAVASYLRGLRAAVKPR